MGRGGRNAGCGPHDAGYRDTPCLGKPQEAWRASLCLHFTSKNTRQVRDLAHSRLNLNTIQCQVWHLTPGPKDSSLFLTYGKEDLILPHQTSCSVPTPPTGKASPGSLELWVQAPVEPGPRLTDWLQPPANPSGLSQPFPVPLHIVMLEGFHTPGSSEHWLLVAVWMVTNKQFSLSPSP